MSATTAARLIRLRGRVQGVGFRPFVHRLARRLRVRGWVRNRAGELEIHAEGAGEALARFLDGLTGEAPGLARVESVLVSETAPAGCEAFAILDSAPGEDGPRVVPPDQAVCPACLAELFDPRERRHAHPFVNCTECGPRYTLIDRLPYDRRNTAMAAFPLCPACRAEYEDPADRRHHAQPLCCPACGPRLYFRRPGAGGPTPARPAQDGSLPGPAAVGGDAEALAACLAALRAGQLVAVKGVGGYHLLCDARNDQAVARLRERKRRPAKPFAVMVPERGQALETLAAVGPDELALLRSPERPIVLLPARAPCPLSPLVAPGVREIGLMLPYSPLHHLLAEGHGGALVATSANRSGEPVLTEPAQAEAALAEVADAFLHHDRPIRRPAEDSVYRRLDGRPRPLRLGRGATPLELGLGAPLPLPVLALGADLKNTVALAAGQRVVLSPHLGDLGSPRSMALLAQVVEDLGRLLAVEPALVLHDAHPGYFSTRWASRHGLPTRAVFHHHAHASALHAEARAEGPVLVFTWDGLGYGADGTLWGGETLLGEPGHWRRVASLRPLRLIGGDRASREPWRCALAACLEAGADWPGAPAGSELARAAWRAGLNCPQSSSAGRLFDAAAALLGLGHQQSHEGEAAARLEALACPEPVRLLPLPLERAEGLWRVDWRALLPELTRSGRPAAERAALFHDSLAATIEALARRLREEHGVERVGLTGGVFQNARLTGRAAALLRAAGFELLLPLRLPVNDAAIAFGQVVEAQATLGAAPD